MKIIKLGKLDIRFGCDNCKTIWEQSTDELEIEKSGEKELYFTKCPLCGYKFEVNDKYGEISAFTKKIKELQKKD